MRGYTQTYDYDRAGNLRQLVHQAAGGGWTRTFTYDEPSALEPVRTGNRLSASSVGAGGPEPHTYDANGNTTSLAGLPSLVWDHHDRLVEIARSGGEVVRNHYDQRGGRVRKTMWRADGTRRHERLYVGALEVYREYDAAGGAVTLERQTLHVTERDRRIALVDTRTAGADPGPAQLARYQYDNHVGTACLELDAGAAVVSYEEYHPYGSTAYQGVRSQLETPKRYRFGAKERDEETGLGYHGARFYAPWLARWTSPDPLLFAEHGAEHGGEDGPSGRHVLAAAVNPYPGMGDNPVILHDPDGLEPADLRKLVQRFIRDARRNAARQAAQEAKQAKAKAKGGPKKSDKAGAAKGAGKGDGAAGKPAGREPREPLVAEDLKKGAAPKGDAKPPETYKIEILVGGPYTRGGEEHRYGHAALRIVTPTSDTTYDYGRYGRTWGRFGSEGEGILNVWSNFQTYIKGENALGRTTTGFSFVVTKEQAEKIQAHFDALVSGRKAILTGKDMQRFRIAADYHALTSNCTTLTLGGAEAAFSDLEAAAGPYNKGNGMSRTERIAASLAGWPTRLFLPADLKNYLQSKDFEANLTKLGLGKPAVSTYQR
jgi:RHS repeat-associated protein